MIHTIKGNRKREIVAAELESTAKEFGFGLVGSYDFKAILERKGFPIEREITVYELCNPEAAQRALQKIPEVSAFLPCRLSLYEEGGQSLLATIGFESILDGIEVEKELEEHLAMLFGKLKALMERLLREA